ncbi:hypothetical protein [Pseudonocardia sp.]|jgi:hippurate hydrolase|uniref:hypothetical protein n=1 Tax=Pseudonocardia sp. TaxID=60912 RepID=UPI003D0AEEE8
MVESSPAVVNDEHATARTRPALEGITGAGRVIDPGPVTGSEDVGVLASAAGAPCVFWLLGGADQTPFAHATSMDEIRNLVAPIPSNHSPRYAPVIDPTIEVGVHALTRAARTWLAES